jgi:hypothetical protein
VVTYVAISMSIGLLVDYLMHALLGFYESTGRNREERVQEMLRTIGSPVLIGGLSTFLGVFPLAFSSSAVMRTVFVSFISMVVLGLSHGLILLPVVLSIVGPNTGGSARSKETALFVARSSRFRNATSGMSSPGAVISFALGGGVQSQFLFVVGCIASVLHGMVAPGMAFLFSKALSSLAVAATDLGKIRDTSFYFLLLGVFTLVVASVQTSCFEVVATRASNKLRLQLFEALLRQDAAFFDVYDVVSIASTIEPNAIAFQLGIGRKLGEGIQFFTAFIGGLAFAFYSSWSLALVILAALPISIASAYAVVTISQTKKARAQSAYASAGSVAYSTVSSIRTVFSLNAIRDVTFLYSEATREAFRQSIGGLWKEGLATGTYLPTSNAEKVCSPPHRFVSFFFKDAWLLLSC